MSATAKQVGVKERPILFSGPMVAAILDGRKTQTRRVITNERVKVFAPGYADDRERILGMCPHGRVGDHLWVREKWADADCMYQGHLNDVPGTIAYFADKSAIQYDSPTPRQIGPIDLASWNWNVLKPRPSIFMPRWASRITLEITNVRVERLQDITVKDIVAEGVQPISGKVYSRGCGVYVEEWIDGWDAINAKRGHSWDSNPFVWVIEFKKV